MRDLMRRILAFFRRPRRPTKAARAAARNVDARYPPGTRGSSTWRDVRRFVLARDGACVECGARAHLTVDHVRPLSKGGSHAPANLRTLCKACHRHRHREGLG